MARKQRRQRGPRAKVDWGRRLATLPLPAVLLGALGLAIVAGPVIKPSLAGENGTTDGYAGIVAGAIERSWLYAVPDSQDESGDVNGRVERARGPDVPAEFDAFIAASWLRDDMNTLDPSIWRFDGTRLEIDPRAHLISGAYQGSSGWRGSILYADSQSLQQLLDERGATAAWLTRPARPGAAAANRTINVISPGAEPEGNASQITFIAASGGPPSAVATLRRVGDHAILRVPRRDRGQVTVSVGATEAAPRGEFQVGWRVLQSGDTLTFSWPGGTRRYQFVQSEPAISRARGDAVRIRAAGLANFARAVEAAAGGGSQSLQTSIDSRLQGATQQLLTTASTSLYGSEGITSFRSAAVLMDGLTGEVAAIPSFPVLPEHLHPSQRGSPAHRRMLERNSNFVRMVAGSAAKPPMALAILNSFPQLGELRISGSNPFQTLAGIDLGTPVPDQPGGEWDFRTFLARSSNKYAAMLMILGLSDADSIRSGACEGPSNETFFIGGSPRNCRPPMAFMEGAQQGPNGARPLRAGRPAGQGWSNNLYSLFCVNPNAPDDRPSVPDLGCLADDPSNRAIWRGFGFQRPRLLAAVSPDREGFGLNVVDDIYQDYVMTILGGNRGRWTTISLAQAFARIVTGRAITARLTPKGIVPGEEVPEEVRLRVNAPSQARVIDGLRAVVSEGTARGLAGAGFPATASNGDQFRLFAKTGTPNVAFLGDDSRQLLQNFASAGCGLRLVTRVPRPGAQPRAVLAVGDNTSLPVAQAIASRPDCQARFGAAATRLADLVRTLNASPSALAQVRADANGRVTAIPPQIALGEGTGHVMVLMVGRYRPGAPDTEPCSLRVAAINFQARTGENRTPALGYALGLLRGDTTRNWFMGAPCAREQRS
ncbi:MAG: hypothetical protein ACK4SZ_10315 [Allosphingosinicella sp.]|uniref:hypothetical protein n=1 Tax=Allosphingosinicella sp. TaxID=2823234 RepID=UPI003924487C